MNDFNKHTTRAFLLMIVFLIVAFFTVAMIYSAIKGGNWWYIFVPLAAVIYGCVAFYKKYKPAEYK